MRLAETRDLFIRRLTFPVEHEAVIEAIGDVELQAPYGENETVGEVLDRAQEAEYGSADQLYDTLVGNVGDAFIGRKYYDDRGSQTDSEEVSF